MLQIMSLVLLLSWNMPQPIGVTSFNRLIVILNILKGSSYVTTRNSIISLQVAFQLILSLGIINALTSIQYLVISSSVKVFNCGSWPTVLQSQLSFLLSYPVKVQSRYFCQNRVWNELSVFSACLFAIIPFQIKAFWKYNLLSLSFLYRTHS